MNTTRIVLLLVLVVAAAAALEIDVTTTISGRSSLGGGCSILYS